MHNGRSEPRPGLTVGAPQILHSRLRPEVGRISSEPRTPTHSLVSGTRPLGAARRRSLPRHPSENSQIYPPPPIEFHSLALETEALGDISPAGPGQAYLPLRADDPVPRNITVPRQGMQGVADLPRISSKTGNPRHLAIGGYTPPGNAPDYCVYALPAF